uniref:Uncharacterized protein n=1 Tax=Anguilla anguilla TaxID=7936 RepID=A0A0E9UCP5_ANGAN
MLSFQEKLCLVKKMSHLARKQT